MTQFCSLAPSGGPRKQPMASPTPTMYHDLHIGTTMDLDPLARAPQCPWRTRNHPHPQQHCHCHKSLADILWGTWEVTQGLPDPRHTITIPPQCNEGPIPVWEIPNVPERPKQDPSLSALSLAHICLLAASAGPGNGPNAFPTLTAAPCPLPLVSQPQGT